MGASTSHNPARCQKRAAHAGLCTAAVRLTGMRSCPLPGMSLHRERSITLYQRTCSGGKTSPGLRQMRAFPGIGLLCMVVQVQTPVGHLLGNLADVVSAAMMTAAQPGCRGSIWPSVCAWQRSPLSLLAGLRLYLLGEAGALY